MGFISDITNLLGNSNPQQPRLVPQGTGIELPPDSPNAQRLRDAGASTPTNASELSSTPRQAMYERLAQAQAQQPNTQMGDALRAGGAPQTIDPRLAQAQQPDPNLRQAVTDRAQASRATVGYNLPSETPQPSVPNPAASAGRAIGAPFDPNVPAGGATPPAGGVPPAAPVEPAGPVSRLAAAANTAKGVGSTAMRYAGIGANVISRGFGGLQAAGGLDDMIDNGPTLKNVHDLTMGAGTAGLGPVGGMISQAADRAIGPVMEGAYQLGQHLPLVRRLYDKQDTTAGPALAQAMNGQTPEQFIKAHQQPGQTPTAASPAAQQSDGEPLPLSQLLSKQEYAGLKKDYLADPRASNGFVYTDPATKQKTTYDLGREFAARGGNQGGGGNSQQTAATAPPSAQSPGNTLYTMAQFKDAQAAQQALEAHPINTVAWGGSSDPNGTVGQVQYRDGTTKPLTRGEQPDDVKQWMDLTNRAGILNQPAGVQIIRPGGSRTTAAPEAGYQEVPQAVAETGQTGDYIQGIARGQMLGTDPLSAQRLQNEGQFATAQEHTRGQLGAAESSAGASKYVADLTTKFEQQKAAMMQELQNPATPDARKRELEGMLGVSRYTQVPTSKDMVGNTEFGTLDTRSGQMQHPQAANAIPRTDALKLQKQLGMSDNNFAAYLKQQGRTMGN